MRTLIIFTLLASGSLFSLEIDEILTLRITGLSESGKTILINRGIEDGLVVGDHAKFYVSSGVIARGVVIKSSPSRSVWSLYRLVNKSFIREEQVLKLKITPPVKITKDESKMLVDDDTSTSVAKDPRDLGIPLAEGAEDLSAVANQTGGSQNSMIDFNAVSLLTKNREVFGMMGYSAYTEKTSPDIQDAESYTRDVSQLYLKLGGEWYFREEVKWYSRFSFLAHFAIDRKSVMAHDGDFVSENASEFGFGVNLHLFKMPSLVHTPISYLNYTLMLGSSNTTSEPGEGCTGTSCTTSADASVFAHNIGFGYKYYTLQGIGARIELAYYLRGDTYGADENGIKWTKTKSGPRLLFGLSYRL